MFHFTRLPLTLWSLVSVVSMAGVSTAHAQWSDFERERLAGEIEAAATNLDPLLFPNLEDSKALVASEIGSAKNFFRANTSKQNNDAWLRYLDFGPLSEVIDSDASDVAIAHEAIDLRYRLVGTAPGLELTVLGKLRDSLEQLIEAVRFRDPERSQEFVAKQLVALAERVREMGDPPSPDDSATINAVLGVLASSGQASELVQRLRNTFSRPNIVVFVAETMVQSAIGRNVNECRPIDDCILGTRIIGTAALNGVVTANLIPAIGAAHVEVSLASHITSNSTGYNGPVRLRTSGDGRVNVSRTLQIDESGVVAQPAYAQAVLNTQIHAIEHPLRLVRKIARKQAAKQKPKADKIAVEKMRRQVGTRFTKQTDEAINAAPPDLFAKIRPVLKRLSLNEPTRLWGSTDSDIFIDATFRRPDQLSTFVSRPHFAGSYDAAVQIHESVLDNALTPVLAGRTMTETNLNELISKSGLPASTTGGIDNDVDEDTEADEPPFEIDFARLRPVIFEARDQTVRLGIRGTRFSQGKRELKRAMEISAIYEPATTDDGVMLLIRKGGVAIDFPGPSKRLTVAQAGLKRTIQKKFANVFPETLLHRPLEVPSTVKLDAIRGRVFHPSLVDAKNGWLTIAVR